MASPLRSLLAALGLLAPTCLQAAQVLFGEIMYNPPAGKPEFLEVRNITQTPLDTAGWRVDEGVTLAFPDFNPGDAQAHFLQPLERLLLSSADPATTRAAYPSIPPATRILGPWTGNLANGGEAVTLRDARGGVVCQVEYGDGGDWPVAADGAGHSLVLVSENRLEEGWRNWRASAGRLGSPGAAEPAAPAPVAWLSELHLNPAGTAVAWVELHNPGATIASATNLFLSSRADLSDRVALSGVLPGGGYAAWNTAFPADADGEFLVVLTDGQHRVLDAVRRAPVAGRPSHQRLPPGGREWYTAAASTRDAANAPPVRTDMVIHEIMADPAGGLEDGEYVELFNRGAAPVNLGGWRLADGVEFVFPPLTVPPGGFAVVAANAEWLNARHPGLGAVGDWSGRLANQGERIRLLDDAGNLADEVDYRFGGDWPERANGLGSSLELVHPSADNALGGAWADSDESAKAAWRPFALTNLYSRTQRGIFDDEIRLWLAGDGHVVLRNLQLRPLAGGPSILVNPSAVSTDGGNVSGWLGRGTHAGSFADAEGVHLVADGRGDNKVGHLDKDATNMVAGVHHVLSFEARWQWGRSRLIAQTFDTTWGGTVEIPVPDALGTPGAANSRARAAPPPQVTALLHSPAVPKPGQAVTVTARVVSADPLASVQVLHRADDVTGANAWASTAMHDDGAGGDAAAGDGTWTAVLTQYPADNQVVQFHVRATTASGQTADAPRAGPAHPGMWVVDNVTLTSGTPGNWRVERYVIPARVLLALNSAAVDGGHTANFGYAYPRMSNHYFPCTYIHDEAEITYGAVIRESGSPFTRDAAAGMARAKIKLPGDRRFRGKEKKFYDGDSTTRPHNRMVRMWLQLLGHPVSESEFVRVVINGNTFNQREDTEPVANDLLDRVFADGTAGQLYRLDDTHYIADDGTTRSTSVNADWAYKGSDNPALYHNSYNLRTRENEYDYGPLVEWTRQLTDNGATLTEAQMERMADQDAICLMAAVRGYASDWDSFTLSRGKNGYFYRRADTGQFMFLHWDSDGAFQSGRQNDTLTGTLAQVPTFFGKPWNQHRFNHYVTRLLQEYTAGSPRIEAWFVAEEAANGTQDFDDAFYRAWFDLRNPNVVSRLGADLTAAFAVTGQSAHGGVADISGTAPSTIARVAVEGQPAAVFAWTGSSAWTLSGVRVASGANPVRLLGQRADGATVATLDTVVNQAGNSPPVAALVCSPDTRRAGLGETVVLDASGSVDPEGLPVSIAWSVTPSAGVNWTTEGPAAVRASFTVPGIYTFQATVSDGIASTVVAREVFAHAAGDLADFSGNTLPAGFTLANAELRDGYSPAAWVSLRDRPGRLLVHQTDAAALPLANPGLRHPLLHRPLPETGDWAAQTEVELDGRTFGTFFTGLWVELLEAGETNRYAVGFENGTRAAARRAVASYPYAAVGAPVALTAGRATVRAVRAGNLLRLAVDVDGVWTPVATLPLLAGTRNLRAGVFTSTSAAQSMRAAFTHLAVADPGNATGFAGNLRITEIMYNPAGTGGVEFIELRNDGAQALNLNGVHFLPGSPVTFTFGDLPLPPGGYAVVTGDTNAFTQTHGPVSRLAGPWVGSLNNGGEDVVLLDPDGNVIQSFRYRDDAGWPAAADGGGPSLEVIDPAGDADNPANWRAGLETGGSPGYLGFAADSDGDGVADTRELAFGADPDNPASSVSFALVSHDPVNGPTLLWSATPGRVYEVERGSGPGAGDWQVIATIPAVGPTAGCTDPAAPSTRAVYRVRTALP